MSAVLRTFVFDFQQLTNRQGVACAFDDQRVPEALVNCTCYAFAENSGSLHRRRSIFDQCCILQNPPDFSSAGFLISFHFERSFSDHLFADFLSGPGEDFPNEFDILFRRIFIVEQTVTECVIDLFKSELSGFACEFLIIISGEIAFFSVA